MSDTEQQDMKAIIDAAMERIKAKKAQDAKDVEEGKIDYVNIEVRPNGHVFGQHALDDFERDQDMYARWDAVDAERAEQGLPPIDDTPVPDSIKHMWRKTHCYACDEYIQLRFENEGIVADNPCSFPYGASAVTYLDVPSGKMVFANDLRQEFPGAGEDDFNINSNMGIYQTIMSYDGSGMAHGFCGNTCPGVHRLSDDHYTISSGAWTNVPAWKKKDKRQVSYTMEPGGERVAGITTDLWWYSVCDYDAAIKTGLDVDISHYYDVVDVQPGRWRFTHHSSNLMWSRDQDGIPTKWCDIEFEGETDEAASADHRSRWHSRLRRLLRSD